MAETSSRPSNRSRRPDADLPESVGRYRIVRRLGEGGMGSVFLAEDTILRREAALKLPLSGTEDDPEVRERFLREARAVATLDHPYICRVYDADEVDGRLYLAMAYIEGQSLADLVRAEGMPPRQVVALVGKLAIAMQEAHARGVVHRDLKPRNIMIRTAGSKREPVIVDFGLARLSGPEDVRMTRVGQVIGTPAYMPPEQLGGNPDETGPSCDIYALGVILYELLAGRLPFAAPYPAVLGQILTQPPLPPSSHRPGLDPRLDAICLKALAKEPSGRQASMLELATELTGYLKDAPATATTGRPVARPVEGDSIPTGADTLVSQLLGKMPGAARPAGPGASPPHVPPGNARPSSGTTRRLVSPKATVIGSTILGIVLVGGLILLVSREGTKGVEPVIGSKTASPGSRPKETPPLDKNARVRANVRVMNAIMAAKDQVDSLKPKGPRASAVARDEVSMALQRAAVAVRAMKSPADDLRAARDRLGKLNRPPYFFENAQNIYSAIKEIDDILDKEALTPVAGSSTLDSRDDVIVKIREASECVSRLDPLGNGEKEACKEGASGALSRAEAAARGGRSLATELSEAKGHLETLFQIGAKNANAVNANEALRIIEDLRSTAR